MLHLLFNRFERIEKGFVFGFQLAACDGARDGQAVGVQVSLFGKGQVYEPEVLVLKASGAAIWLTDGALKPVPNEPRSSSMSTGCERKLSLKVGWLKLLPSSCEGSGVRSFGVCVNGSLFLTRSYLSKRTEPVSSVFFAIGISSSANAP